MKSMCTKLRSSKSLKCSSWRTGLRFLLQVSLKLLDYIKRFTAEIFSSDQASQGITYKDADHFLVTSKVFTRIFSRRVPIILEGTVYLFAFIPNGSFFHIIHFCF